MDNLALLVFAGFFLFFGLVVVYAIRSSRKAAAQKQEVARAAGFTLLPEPPLEIVQRIISLYETTHRKRFKLERLWVRSFPDGQFFLFDLQETSGEDSTQLANLDLLVVSPYLDLPRFSLMPRLEMTGRLSDLANRFVRWAAETGGTRPLDSLGHEAFDQRYLVLGPDHTAIRSFLTPDRLDWLSHCPNYSLEAGRDAFTLSMTKYGVSRTGLPPSPEDIAQKLRDGLQFFNRLAGPTARPANPAAPRECAKCGALPEPGSAVCAYCGSPVDGSSLAVAGFAPAAAAGAQAADWQLEPGNEWVRPEPRSRHWRLATFVDSLGCMLPFGLVWTAFSLLFLFIGIFGYIRERQTYTLLTQEGVSATATVTELYESTDSEGSTTYYVGYNYTASVAGNLAPLSTQQSVPKSVYETLQTGMQIDIIYAASQPETSEIVVAFAPPGLMLPVCFGGMGFVFTLIGLFLIASSFGSIRKAAFNKV